MTDFCRYADVFYGNGEVDHFSETGPASKWFYIKALCGNTLPHATLPFGRISVGAYSSGYPTGYGTHYPNSCGGIRKLWDSMKVRGFSHLHQSGTGAIQYYYNYAILSPFMGDLKNAFSYDDPTNEHARPGLYGVTFREIQCRLTVSYRVALHAYRFPAPGGRVALDCSNDGLSRLFGEQFYALPKDAHVRIVSPGTVLFDALYSGVRLYFCVRLRGEDVRCALYEGEAERTETSLDLPEPQDFFGAVFDTTGQDVEAIVAYSTLDADHALADASAFSATFDETAQKAYEIWNEHLSRLEIEAPDEIKTKFYSNLYHSLIKPADLTGEDVMGVRGDCVSDFATFWDQYKTALPLIYAFYPEMGKKAAKGIVSISRALNRISCSFGLSTILPAEEQAKMLGVISLCDAYYAHLISAEEIEECVRRELARDDYRVFLEQGVFERYTHILDVSDGCRDVANLCRDPELKSRLLSLADNLRNAYGPDGLLSEKSPYYEGDRYTYSFRIHPNMDQRIALAGGKERYERLLDDFFGFTGGSVAQVTDVERPYVKIAELAARYHRFQGFNNEPDMETPYNYLFVGRHDKLDVILNAACDETFSLGRGGLPGNNDSGGLSACYVWNALGLFPASGTGRFLLGCPQVDSARLMLPGGKTLAIETVRATRADRFVDRVSFDGAPVSDFTLTADQVYSGGVLRFFMKPSPEGV